MLFDAAQPSKTYGASVKAFPQRYFSVFIHVGHGTRVTMSSGFAQHFLAFSTVSCVPRNSSVLIKTKMIGHSAGIHTKVFERCKCIQYSSKSDIRNQFFCHAISWNIFIILHLLLKKLVRKRHTRSRNFSTTLAKWSSL